MFPTIYPSTVIDTAVHYSPRDTTQTVQLEANAVQIDNRDTFGIALTQYSFGSAIIGLTWEQRVTLARLAQGTWSDGEGRGTSVEVVRQLRNEWD